MPRPPKTRCAQMCAVLLLATGMFAQESAQNPEADAKAAAVRAAFLFKFASYLTNESPGPDPRKPPSEYRIGIVGDDATAAIAKKLLPGKKIGEARIVIVTISADDAEAGRAASQCDILYIATPIEDASLTKIVAAHASKPVPMVCERPGFAAAGGSIQLFVQGGGVRFEVNTSRLHEQKIKASSQLLRHSQPGPTQ